MAAPTSTAFVSYSSADRPVVEWLEGELHGLLRRPLGGTEIRVLRDQTTMTPGPDLWQRILGMIDSADWFILTVSPSTPLSAWVEREFQEWSSKPERSQRVIVVAFGSGFRWNGAGGFTAPWLPSGVHLGVAAEPLFVEIDPTALTPGSQRSAVVKVAAALLGVPPAEVESTEKSLRTRRKRIVAGLGSAIAVAVLVASILAGVTVTSRAAEARERRASRASAMGSLALGQVDDQLDLGAEAAVGAWKLDGTVASWTRLSEVVDRLPADVRVLTDLPFEPSALALSSNETEVYVGGFSDGTSQVVRVDLGSGAVEAIEAPDGGFGFIYQIEVVDDRFIAVAGDDPGAPDGSPGWAVDLIDTVGEGSARTELPGEFVGLARSDGDGILAFTLDAEGNVEATRWPLDDDHLAAEPDASVLTRATMFDNLGFAVGRGPADGTAWLTSRGETHFVDFRRDEPTTDDRTPAPNSSARTLDDVSEVLASDSGQLVAITRGGSEASTRGGSILLMSESLAVLDSYRAADVPSEACTRGDHVYSGLFDDGIARTMLAGERLTDSAVASVGAVNHVACRSGGGFVASTDDGVILTADIPLSRLTGGRIAIGAGDTTEIDGYRVGTGTLTADSAVVSSDDGWEVEVDGTTLGTGTGRGAWQLRPGSTVRRRPTSCLSAYSQGSTDTGERTTAVVIGEAVSDSTVRGTCTAWTTRVEIEEESGMRYLKLWRDGEQLDLPRARIVVVDESQGVVVVEDEGSIERVYKIDDDMTLVSATELPGSLITESILTYEGGLVASSILSYEHENSLESVAFVVRPLLPEAIVGYLCSAYATGSLASSIDARRIAGSADALEALRCPSNPQARAAATPTEASAATTPIDPSAATTTPEPVVPNDDSDDAAPIDGASDAPAADAPASIDDLAALIVAAVNSGDVDAIRPFADTVAIEALTDSFDRIREEVGELTLLTPEDEYCQMGSSGTGGCTFILNDGESPLRIVVTYGETGPDGTVGLFDYRLEG